MALVHLATISLLSGNGTSISGSIGDSTAVGMIALVLSCSSAAATPTDSFGNTYTLAVQSAAAQYGNRVAIYYNLNPTDGPAHTFFVTATNPALAVVIYDVPAAACTVTNSAIGTGPNVGATGSLTPTGNNQAILAALSMDGLAATIDSPFTLGKSETASGGQYFGIGAAHFEQTTAALVNPTWTSSGSASLAGAIAAFTTATGGGPTGQGARLSTLRNRRIQEAP